MRIVFFFDPLASKSPRLARVLASMQEAHPGLALVGATPTLSEDAVGTMRQATGVRFPVLLGLSSADRTSVGARTTSCNLRHGRERRDCRAVVDRNPRAPRRRDLDAWDPRFVSPCAPPEALRWRRSPDCRGRTGGTMLPWIAALTGLVNLRCPHCGHAQARSRHQDPVICTRCNRNFAQKAGREAHQKVASLPPKRK